MRLDDSLTPNDVLFSGIEALHPEVPRLQQIVDGWASRTGLPRGGVLDLAIRCPDWEIVRRIILAETIKWPDSPRLWLDDVARPFYEPQRKGWMSETTREYPLGAILGLLQSVTWHINRHMDKILWKRREEIQKTGILDGIPNWFGWVLSAGRKPDHWIREITDPLLPDPKWSGDLSNAFGDWRKVMEEHDRAIYLGDLMRVFTELFNEHTDEEFASLDFGAFGSTFLAFLNFSLFGQLTPNAQARALWKGFVSTH